MKHNGHHDFQSRLRAFKAVVLVLFAASLFAGCNEAEVDQALDSDANGYVCLACKAKFYTARKVFPTRCPDCKKPNIEQAVGFVCQADKQMTIDSRGHRSVPCKQCGATTAGLGIPREVDFKAWGAGLKTEAEVTGQ